MLNPRMTQRAVRTDCKRLRLDVETKLLPNKDENEDSTDLAPWGFVFRINAFPAAPGFHSHITRISPAEHLPQRQSEISIVHAAQRNLPTQDFER